MVQNSEVQLDLAPLSANLWLRWGALRILKTTPEWSRMVVSVMNMPVYTPLGVSGELSGGSLEVLRGFMGSPGTVLRALGSILGLWAFLADSSGVL